MPTDQDTEPAFHIVQPGGGELVSSQRVRIKAEAEQTGGQASVIEVFNPGFGGPPLHVHHHHDEMFYVVEGEYLFQVGDETISLGAGAFASVPRGIPHTFASTAAVPGKLLIISMPSGLETFLWELERLVAAGAGEDAIRQMGEAHDAELTGPPLSPS